MKIVLVSNSSVHELGIVHVTFLSGMQLKLYTYIYTERMSLA